MSETTTWTGWLRLPGGRWQAVVSDVDEDTAWRRLRERVEALGVRFADTFVAVGSADPNQKPRRRRF